MTHTPALCKAKVRDRSSRWPTYNQCQRAATTDGYCKQHHPDTEKARAEKRDKDFKEKWATGIAKSRLNAAAPELLDALKAALIRLQFADKHIDCSDEIAQAQAAIAKATP